MYYVFLKNHDMLEIVKVNQYNEDVEKILKWFFSPNYKVILVLKNPELIFCESWAITTKKEMLEEMKSRKEGYWWDEEGEELEEKLKFLESILAS